MRQSLYGMLFAATLVLTGTMPASAQDLPPAEPLRGTIQNQLDAFTRDDFPAAFGFASPKIKGIFVTPENFGRMVAQGYPMVMRPGAVRMLELRNVAGGLWQRVMITDTDGRTHMLDYKMIQAAEGWQIDAVQILPQDGVGA